MGRAVACWPRERAVQLPLVSFSGRGSRGPVPIALVSSGWKSWRLRGRSVVFVAHHRRSRGQIERASHHRGDAPDEEHAADGTLVASQYQL